MRHPNIIILRIGQLVKIIQLRSPLAGSSDLEMLKKLLGPSLVLCHVCFPGKYDVDPRDNRGRSSPSTGTDRFVRDFLIKTVASQTPPTA